MARAPQHDSTYLKGKEWVLRSFAAGDPAPADPRITLVFEDGRIVGAGGCNRYFAQFGEGAQPGEISFGAVGATRMACEESRMSLEARYFASLGAVTRFAVSEDTLALEYVEDGVTRTLSFAAQPKQ